MPENKLGFQPLREVLEAIWRDNTVRCPRHITWWNSDHGTHVAEADMPLFYAKGERVDARKKRRIGGAP